MDFPSDDFHLLLSKLVNYENIKKENFEEIKEKIQQPAQINSSTSVQESILNKWEILDVFETNNDSKLLKMCSVRAIIFKNHDSKQMILAFKGFEADFTDIIERKSELFFDLNGIILNGLLPQLFKCFEITEKTCKIAKEGDFVLSFTGYSNGAWLAEHAIHFAHVFDLNIEKSKLKAVLFDGPGIYRDSEEVSFKSMHKSYNYYKENILDEQSETSLRQKEEEKIVNYLSKPSFSNCCNKHHGDTFIVLDYTIKKIKETNKVSNFFNFIDEFKPKLRCFNKIEFEEYLSIFDHNYFPEFNLNEKKIANDWPVLKLSLGNCFKNNLKKLLDKPLNELVNFIPIPNLSSLPSTFLLRYMLTCITSIITENAFPGLHLLLNVLHDVLQTNENFSILTSMFENTALDEKNKSTKENLNLNETIKLKHCRFSLVLNFDRINEPVYNEYKERIFLENHNKIPCIKPGMIERKNVILELDSLFEKNQFIIIKGPSGLGKTTVAVQFACFLSEKNKNNFIRFLDSDKSDKIFHAYNEIANIYKSNSENIKNEKLSTIYNMIKKEKEKDQEKIFLLIFDNLDYYSFLENYIKDLPEDLKILITTKNSDIEQNLSSQFKNKVKTYNLEKIFKYEAQDYVKKNLSIFSNNEREKIFNCLFEKKMAISGLNLDLALKFVKDRAENIVMCYVLRCIKTKDPRELIKKVIKSLDKDSNEFKLLRVMKYFDNEFISYRILVELTDLTYEDLIKTAKILEHYGLIIRIERYNKLGFSFHDDVLEELRTFFKDDQFTFNSVLKKIFNFIKTKLKALRNSDDQSNDQIDIDKLKNSYKDLNPVILSLNQKILDFIRYQKDIDTEKIKSNHLWEEFYYHMLALAERKSLDDKLAINKFMNKEEIFDSLKYFEPNASFIVDTCEFVKFPSDLVHLLMCQDVYKDYHEKKYESKEKITFNGEDWTVNNIYNQKTKILEMCKFKAVVYTNEARRQMVVAFKGLEPKLSDIFNKEGGLTNNLEAIFLKGTTAQLVKCFQVTEVSCRYAQNRNYNLSFTGFSNGAWLAEHAINFIPHIVDEEFKASKVKAVLFDSHGIVKEDKKREDGSKFWDLSNNITCYLSNPNFANSCNIHHGNVYRIFIDYETVNFDQEEKILAEIQNAVLKARNLLGYLKNKINFCGIGDTAGNAINNAITTGAETFDGIINNKTFIKNIKFFLGGLKSLFSKDIIDKFILEFDVKTGKPKYYEKVIVWPLVKVNLNKDYKKNFEKMIQKPISTLVGFIPYPEHIKIPAEIVLNIIFSKFVNTVTEHLLPGAHFIINILYEFWEENIDFSILDSKSFNIRIKDGIDKINDFYIEAGTQKAMSNQLDMKSICRYKTETIDENKRKLKPLYPNIDWYLFHLKKSENKIEKNSIESTQENVLVLKNILRQYKLIEANNSIEFNKEKQNTPKEIVERKQLSPIPPKVKNDLKKEVGNVVKKDSRPNDSKPPEKIHKNEENHKNENTPNDLLQRKSYRTNQNPNQKRQAKSKPAEVNDGKNKEISDNTKFNSSIRNNSDSTPEKALDKIEHQTASSHDNNGYQNNLNPPKVNNCFKKEPHSSPGQPNSIQVFNNEKNIELDTKNQYLSMEAVVDALIMFKEENPNKLKNFLFRVDPLLSDHVFLKSELIDRRRIIYKVEKIFNQRKNLFITGSSGIGKTTFALQYQKYLFDNNLIDSLVFWQSNYLFKIHMSFKKLNKILGSTQSDFNFEEFKQNFVSKEKNSLFVFDNVEDFEDIEEYINCLTQLENAKVLIISNSLNRDHLKKPCYEKFEEIKLPEFNKEDAEDHIKTHLDFFNTEDRERVINTLFNDNKLISGLKLDLILKYAKKEEFENNLDSFFKILTNNTDIIIIQEIIKQFDYRSLQLKLLKIIQYLDYSFISFQCLTYLSDIPVKLIADYVAMFEKKGILNHFYKYDLEGVSLNKIIVDELRNNFKDDTYLFKSTFNKIEKWLLYQTSEIKYEVFNVDLEFCYHFLETSKLLKTESYSEDYKDRIDQIIEKITKSCKNDKHETNSNSSMIIDNEMKKAEIGRKLSNGSETNPMQSEVAIQWSKYIQEQWKLEQQELEKQGLIHYEQGDYLNAIMLFEKSLKNNDIETCYKAEMFFKLAHSYFILGDDKNAIKYYKKCLKTNDIDQNIEIAHLLNLLGLAYLNFGECDKAVKFAKYGLDIEPNEATILATLAKCYYYNGKLNDAQVFINKSLDLFEKTENECFFLANAYIIEASIMFKLDINNISRAIEKCRDSLEILKRFDDDEKKLYRAHDIANAYKYLGKFYLAKGDVYNSIKHLKKAKSAMKKEFLTKHPLYAKILHHLGVAFLKNGNDLLGRKYLEQSIKLCTRILPESHPVTISVLSDLENFVSKDE